MTDGMTFEDVRNVKQDAIALALCLLNLDRKQVDALKLVMVGMDLSRQINSTG
ncbi:MULTISPECIES: hypothetical protein [Erysipelotrichaceae]|uniref:hypothetical protein n=1 Tax=Erysipelotrichaceae TaxID=128827 RepID=UPI0013144D06|nr:hypothetical protein [Absiella sp. AM27-20]